MRASLFAVLMVASAMSACSDDDDPSNSDGGATLADAALGDAATSGDGGATLECDPMFEHEEACGGDISGAWRYVGVCGLPNALTNFIAGCPAALITENSHTITGTVGWNADQTYGWVLHDEFAVAFEVPVDCTSGCDAFAIIVSLAAEADVTCMERDQLCDCFSIGTRDDRQVGIYSALEGTITTTRSSDGDVHQYDYCVGGDRALLRRTDEGIVLVLER